MASKQPALLPLLCATQATSKVIIIVKQSMLMNTNIFWVLLRVHFNPCQAARAKMGLSWAQNIIFISTNINNIVLFYCRLCTSTNLKWPC